MRLTVRFLQYIKDVRIATNATGYSRTTFLVKQCLIPRLLLFSFKFVPAYVHVHMFQFLNLAEKQKQSKATDLSSLDS